MFRERRTQLIEALRARGGKNVAVFAATPVMHRNSDVEHDYRQDSDLFYLSGVDEPESCLVVSAVTGRSTLFVRTRDPEREVWDGARIGVEGALTFADEAFPINELAERLPKLLSGHDCVCARLGRDEQADARLFEAVRRSRALARSGALFPQAYVDPAAVLHPLRLIKSEAELAHMQKAADITAIAHTEALRALRPGMNECEIEGVLLAAFHRGGAARAAYGSIVGSGPNATTLHYRANNRTMLEGELLLIDAGCEYAYYASDVTRTFPVSGAFSAPQQRIYELVLEAQLAAIEMTKPGTTLDAIHARTVEVLTHGLVKLGILQGEPAKLIEEQKYKPFYMHRTSHWLGMDVHDAGAYFHEGSAVSLRPGMVFTIEPGLYFGTSVKEPFPEEYRGIGVRIEDDIVVTASGHRNLTAAIPKTVKEVSR
jgi:Xaa-Pro aminopeptidase